MNAPSKVLDTTLQRRVEMLAQLVVTSERLDQLLVDATNLAGSDGPRFWRLLEDDAGQWRHPESGVSGNLGHVLFAIAASYEVDVEQAKPERPKLKPARRRVLEVLAHGQKVGRPVRSSDHTTDLDTERPPAAPVDLCVHTRVVGGLERQGLAERTDRLSYYYRLTDAGHALLGSGG